MFTQKDADHLAALRSQTETVLREAIGDTKDVALLDAPTLVNVGDSLIWAGQLAYMERMGYRVRYISDMNSFDERRLRRALSEGGTILLRGGGNFGDVWKGHQDHRERIAQMFPEHRIVQLTQSVMFRDPERAKRANAILGAHPNFRLLVRDELSMQRATELLPNVHSTPCLDMALGWDPRPEAKIKPKRNRVLVIARDDREASSGLAKAAPKWTEAFDVTVTDWGSHAPVNEKWWRLRKQLKLHQHALQLRRKTRRLFPALPQRVLVRWIQYMNTWNIDSAVDIFQDAQAVVVDRLHAHIIAARLGIPHVVLDNDHGKISTVYNAYTGQFSTAHYATSVDEARELLSNLVKQ